MKVHGRYEKTSQRNEPCFNPQEQCALNTKVCVVRGMNKTVKPSLHRFEEVRKFVSVKLKNISI